MAVNAPFACALFARMPFEASPRLPALEKWLARGRQTPTPLWWQYCQQLSATLSLRGEGGGVAEGHWLHADPVHLSLRRDHFILEQPADLQLRREEAQSLLASLNQHFGLDGLHFLAPHPLRWYLRVEAKANLLTHPLARVVGRDTRPWLPQGDEAIQWQRWLNEAQMLLHEHPVNQAREAKGLAAVNSLWLHADAPAAALPPGDLPDQMWSDQVLGRGFASTWRVPLHAAPADAESWLDSAAPVGGHALMLDVISAELLDQRWCAPLLRALSRGRLDALVLYVIDGETVTGWHLRRQDLWKFWRRPQPVWTRLAASVGVSDGG